MENLRALDNFVIKNPDCRLGEKLYFILKDFVNSLKFPSITYTVGPKSLSKGELIAIFEENYE